MQAQAMIVIIGREILRFTFSSSVCLVPSVLVMSRVDPELVST